MNLEEDYRKAQRDGTFELYGFFVSNLKELDELERRTVNLRYQIVELLISYHLHELEEANHLKILVSKEELPNFSNLEKNPVTFSDVFYLAVHSGTISEEDVLVLMNRSFRDAHIIHPMEFMHCKYETNQEYDWNQVLTRNRAISLFDKVQKEGSPKYVKRKQLH